ncbi:helix-turn-helix domain-containing protein [Nocardioides panacis]|uniref:Helix-turn-helix domain-containing protein n=1 Tax=Nocardioides panacis TaxID=2849501 RepID=A0A975T2C4_9ACTN|nr:helix-turn-helix domain-containing protein [Nocardioides panacis]
MVACLWQHDAVEGAGTRVVPDACVDLLWLGDRLFVAGPDTGPVVWESLPAVSGIRLRPGAAGPVLGLPASEVRDQLVPLADLWPEAGAVTGTALDDEGRRRWLTGSVLRHRADPDQLVRAAGRRLAVPGARVGRVAAELGVSERRLHRRTVAAVGYGPKTLARVVRLRRLVDLPGPLAARAAEAGYASQAHMSDEVRRLTGLSAVRFLEDARRTAA